MLDKIGRNIAFFFRETFQFSSRIRKIKRSLPSNIKKYKSGMMKCNSSNIGTMTSKKVKVLKKNCKRDIKGEKCENSTIKLLQFGGFLQLETTTDRFTKTQTIASLVSCLKSYESFSNTS